MDRHCIVYFGLPQLQSSKFPFTLSHTLPHLIMPPIAPYKSVPITKKPALDDRTYLYITLENDLAALVCSDPTTDRAGACIDIHVGSLCDPDGVEGLAHFLEHLCEGMSLQ